MALRAAFVRELAAALMVAALAGSVRADEPDLRPTREVLLPRVVSTFIRVKMSAGHLVIARLSDEWAGGPAAPADYRLDVFDRDGNSELVLTPGAEVEGATRLTVHDLAATRDGNLVVAMEAWSTGDRRPAALLVEYEIRTGALLRRVRTDPMTCMHLATEGTSIWCLGMDRSPFNGDAPLIYQFSLAGELTGALFPANELAGVLYFSSGGPYTALVASDGHAAARLIERDDLLLWDEYGAHPRCVAAPRPAPQEAAAKDELAMLPGGRLLGFLVAPDQPARARVPERALYDVGASGRCREVSGFPRGLPYLLIGSEGGQVVFLDVPLGKLLWYPVTDKVQQ